MDLRRAALLAAVLAACSGGGGNGDRADAGPRPDAAAGPVFEEAPATVRISVPTGFDGGRWAWIRAVLRTEAEPAVHAEAMREGACRLLTAPANPFCDPPCGDGELCTGMDVCTPWPPTLPAGTLTVDAGERFREIEPLVAGEYHHLEPDPIFPPGTPVVVSAPGAAFPAFAVAEVVPAELALLSEPPEAVSGDPLPFRWQPVGGGARIRITLRSDTAAHGRFPPAIVECDLPDDAGEVTIPGSIMAAFADPAHWGCGECPTSTVARYHRATSAGTAPVDLIVASETGFYLFGP